MLTTQLPFDAETKEDLFHKVVHHEIDYTLSHYDALPIEALDLMDQLLSKSKRMRLSASEALKHLWLEEEEKK